MSLSTLVSYIAIWVLVLGSMFLSAGTLAVYFDGPSIIIVAGCTFISIFVGFEAKTAINGLKAILAIFPSHKDANTSLKNEVGRIIRWGYIVQKNGLQGLESDAEGLAQRDRFLGFGIDLVITGYTGDEVRNILSATVDTTYERGKSRIDVLKDMAGNAPAFGMLGTLMGLIVMLGNMGGDPASIGAGMAVALITSMYGIVLARLIFMPAAAKLKERDDISQFRNFLLAEGLALLAERKSPRYIQDKMNSYLDPSQHYSIDRDMTDRP